MKSERIPGFLVLVLLFSLFIPCVLGQYTTTIASTSAKPSDVAPSSFRTTSRSRHPTDHSLATSMSPLNNSNKASVATNLTTNDFEKTTVAIAPIPKEPVHNITQLKILNLAHLKLFLFPTEDSLQFEVQLNLAKWNGSTKSVNSSMQESLQLSFGFQRAGEHSVIDVVTMSLDNENSNETSNSSSAIKDSYWNAKLGNIDPDQNQNYKLEGFFKNPGSLDFSIRFVRPWLSCDEQDVQFSLSSMRVYWRIALPEPVAVQESRNGSEIRNSSATTTSVPGQNGGGASKRTTSTSTSFPISMSTTAKPGADGLSSKTTAASTDSTSSSSTASFTSGSNNLKNISGTTSGDGNKTMSTTTTTLTPLILNTWPDMHFIGPVNVSLTELFQNFSRLQIKGCVKTYNSIHQCSFKEYASKPNLSSPESPFYIVKAVHGLNGSAETAKMAPEACPDAAMNFRSWSQGQGRSEDVGVGLGTVAAQKKNTAPAARIGLSSFKVVLAFFFGVRIFMNAI